MSEEAVEIRLRTLEQEVRLLRTSGERDAEFRAEMRAFIAEQRAYGKDRANNVADTQRRLQLAEDSIAELEKFKAKIVGAVAAAGLFGGMATAGFQYLLSLISA